MQAARGASLTSDSHPTRSRSRLGWVLGIAVAAWAVDLGTKTLAVHRLSDGEQVNVIGSLLKFQLTFNSGAAFSTGTGLTQWISTFAIIAFVVVLVVARRVGTLGWAWAIGLLLAGIAGNLTDRLFRDPSPLRGHVVDFLALPNWPIFNVADICINIAAGLIILFSFRGIPLSGQPATAEESAEEPKESGPA
ncbi:signal peptidase II [Nocardioides marmoriginsengisoli]|uniref:Lipoprotein signal peptidase n=1 Tax=Nocardioides marmoriginsengisoli TaxID=661483 RepID=A0A3N0CNW3_9ACTN|nr:signal peptidase II [Nocardioides marmoriginsengisoli]RNL64991.1 signal peptidase II [Nocardioides marmoriginsengisoli]